MKRHALFALLALLSTFIPRKECNPVFGSNDELTGCGLAEEQRPTSLPIRRVRLGDEVFIRLNDPKHRRRAFGQCALPRANAVKRKFTQKQLQEEVDERRNVLTDTLIQLMDSAERKRRGDEAPISLDLTFHLLREVLEMARAEQLVQQASNNRKMMDFFGK